MENEVKLLLPNNLYDDIKRVTESDINFSVFKGKTVLVNSAAEMLGYYIVCALLISNDLYDTNIKVVAVDKDDSIFTEYGKLTARQDIEFIVSKDFSMTNERCDYVINTDKPCSETEVINIINYIRAAKASAVINCGSEIYGDVFNGKDSISEADFGYCDSYKTENFNIQLERLMDTSAKVAAKEYGLDIKLSRICQVFGYKESGNDDGYFNIFNTVANKKNIEIKNKDKTLRSYIYVTDAAVALLKVLLFGESGEVYNISSGYIASNDIIAQYCVKLFENLGIKVVYKDKENFLSPMAPTIDNLNNNKLKSLGFTPEVELQDGIVRAVKNLYEVRE